MRKGRVWKTVEYSRTCIEKAGSKGIGAVEESESFREAVKIIDNWRAAHAYPLHCVYMSLRRVLRNKNVIVVERLKRLNSIIGKLKRENGMSLWRMQDLGGCRVIVRDVEEVYECAQRYEKSGKRHLQNKVNDYINSPKSTGYRSLHVVYQYFSESKPEYNKNMLVEIQYRTRIQHLWATAVETVGIFTKEALKAGQGNEEIRRFFALVSSLFALKENMPIVPETPTDCKALIDEIRRIDERYHILGRLRAYRVATEKSKIDPEYKNGYCLLILNYKTGMLRILRFKSKEGERARQLYEEIEKNNNTVDAVLVYLSSFDILKSAYPNYFTDIGEFVKEIEILM